jgi:hypothetical protein
MAGCDPDSATNQNACSVFSFKSKQSANYRTQYLRNRPGVNSQAAIFENYNCSSRRTYVRVSTA